MKAFLLVAAALVFGAEKAVPVAPAASAAVRAVPARRWTLPARLIQTPLAQAVAKAFASPSGAVQAVEARPTLASVETLAQGLAQAERRGAPAGGVDAALRTGYDQAKLGGRDSEAAVAVADQPARRSFLSRGAAAVRSGARTVPGLGRRMIGGPDVPAGIVSLAFLWNFLTIMSYSLLGPVKEALAVIDAGPSQMPLVLMGCAAATGVVVAGYNRLAHLVSKVALIAGSLAVFSATYGAWSAVIASSDMGRWLSGSLYVWADVLGAMQLTLLWSYINDVFRKESWRKSFGFIAAGASVGGMVGSAVAALAVKPLGLAAVMGLACGTFALTLGAFWLIVRAVARQPAVVEEPAPSSAPEKSVWRAIAASPLLRLMTVLVFLERFVPDFSFQLYRIVMHAAYPEKLAYAAIQGEIAFWQNLAAIAFSLSFAWVLKSRVGLRAALSTAALVNLAGLALFPLFALHPALPLLGLVVGYNGLEGLQRYSWFKSAKEVAYSQVDRGVLYQAKAVIEAFVYRFARGLAGGAMYLLQALGGTTLLALVGVPLAAAWVWTGWRLAGRLDPPAPGQST